MTIIRSIRANVYIPILCNEAFLWNVMGSHYVLKCLYILDLSHHILFYQL